jgi:hypothetical protein
MAIHNPHLRDGLRDNGQGLKFVDFMPLAPDDDWFKTSTAFAAVANPSVTVTTWAKAYCPLWPTTVTTVVTDNAADDWTGVTVVITGIDQFGNVATETVTGSNSSGTWTAAGSVAWAKLTSVTITVAGTTTTNDAYKIGYAKTYGLGCKISATADVICSEFNNAADAGTASAVYHTYAVAGTPDAAKLLTLLVRAAPASPGGF